MKVNIFSSVSGDRMLFALLLMVQFVLWDAILTHVFAGSGLVREANRLVSSAVYSGQFLLFKLLGLVVIVPALLTVYRFYPRIALATTAVVASYYVAVVIWNFLVLFTNTI